MAFINERINNTFVRSTENCNEWILFYYFVSIHFITSISTIPKLVLLTPGIKVDTKWMADKVLLLATLLYMFSGQYPFADTSKISTEFGKGKKKGKCRFRSRKRKQSSWKEEKNQLTTRQVRKLIVSVRRASIYQMVDKLSNFVFVNTLNFRGFYRKEMHQIFINAADNVLHRTQNGAIPLSFSYRTIIYMDSIAFFEDMFRRIVDLLYGAQSASFYKDIRLDLAFDIRFKDKEVGLNVCEYRNVNKLFRSYIYSDSIKHRVITIFRPIGFITQ